MTDSSNPDLWQKNSNAQSKHIPPNAFALGGMSAKTNGWGLAAGNKQKRRAALVCRYTRMLSEKVRRYAEEGSPLPSSEDNTVEGVFRTEGVGAVLHAQHKQRLVGVIAKRAFCRGSYSYHAPFGDQFVLHRRL